LEDIRVLGLTSKVEVKEDEKCTDLFPQKTLAHVEVVCKDGKKYEEAVEHPKGEPENPMSMKEIKEKFTSLSKSNDIIKIDVDEIANIIFDFENRYNELFKAISHN